MQSGLHSARASAGIKMGLHVLNVSSLLVLVCILCLLVIFCAYDIFLWVRNDLRELIAVGTSFTILILGALLLLSSRRMAFRTSFADIPKLYVPINRSDLPKPVYELVQAGLSRTASIQTSAKPLVDQIPDSIGLGKPHSTFEGLRFKDAAICTIAALEAVCKISDHLERDCRMTSRGYVMFLVDRGVISKDIARFYIDQYEAVRFGNRPMGELEYREFMKLFTALIRTVGVLT
ncbi:hypothetical protein O5D80_005016 [Batrachochytrium dendrobatidis]|nr:hypothetical protein O5D80_005016 [Batrachochytrium dendrobatidis]